MPFYQILPTRRLPQIFLTYKSLSELRVGQLVKVNIRGSLVEGIVAKEQSEEDIGFEAKEISEILPYVFSKTQLDFLYTFSQNTFNSLSLTLDAVLQSFTLLTKKQWLELKTDFTQKTDQIAHKAHSDKDNSDFNFYLENDILVRIIYLIRTVQNTSTNLIIFPEKKSLNLVLNILKKNREVQNIFKEKIIEVQVFTGDPTKTNQTTVWKILHSQNDNSTLLIFGTRSSLFLPFPRLEQIILVDEANSMYIQEQNKIYFDTRDAIFLLSQAYQSQLNFVSTLPSVRLYSFYSERFLEEFVTSNTQNNLKSLQIENMR